MHAPGYTCPPRHTCPPGTHAPPRYVRSPRHTCSPGHAHPPGRYLEMQSMSGRYAAYWNAFLLMFKFSDETKESLVLGGTRRHWYEKYQYWHQRSFDTHLEFNYKLILTISFTITLQNWVFIHFYCLSAVCDFFINISNHWSQSYHQQSTFSQAHKVGNNGINNFCIPTKIQFFFIIWMLIYVSKCEIRCQLVKGITFRGNKTLLVFPIFNGTAKMKLVILAFLYCEKLYLTLQDSTNKSLSGVHVFTSLLIFKEYLNWWVIELATWFHWYHAWIFKPKMMDFIFILFV